MSSPSPSSSDPSTALIVVAHGSRSPEATAAHIALVDGVAERLATPVTAAFLELAEPSLVDAIDAAASMQRDVVVLPYFIHPGRHVREHIPEIVESARRRHPTTTITLLEPFGDDPELESILADQLLRGLGRLDDPPSDAHQ